MIRCAPSRQYGAALISVIFLIVVMAILGAVVMRTASDQQQVATLKLLEVRTNAAAFSGIEYASNQLKNSAFACSTLSPGTSTAILLPAAAPQTNGITVTVQCLGPIDTGAGSSVYDLTATASFSTFGNLDFVERVERRRVGAGSW